MQKNVTIKFKRFYIPGMISLIFFPILCVCYITISTIKTEERAIKVTMPPPDGSDVIITSYSFEVPKRNFRQIRLDGISTVDKTNLEYAELAIRRIVKDRDTINGIKFTFNKNSSYGTWVSALNICLKENAKQYVAKGNDIWVFNNFEKEKLPSNVNKLNSPYFSLENDMLYMESEEDKLYNQKKKINFMIERLNFLILPIIIFVTLVVCAIRKVT